MKGEFELRQTRDLCEDIAAMIHRHIVRMNHKGIGQQLLMRISRKSKVPIAKLRRMYEGMGAQATTEDVGAVQWACQEMLKDK